MTQDVSQQAKSNADTDKRRGSLRAEFARKISQIEEMFRFYTKPEPSLGSESDVLIDYENDQGERSKRVVRPIMLRFAKNDWYPQQLQWLLMAWDFNNKAVHAFAMKDVHAWYAPGSEGGFKVPDLQVGWQPIETAPSAPFTGWVWTWNADRPDWGVARRRPDGEWWRALRKRGEVGPTHWQPEHVPEPPQTQEQT